MVLQAYVIINNVSATSDILLEARWLAHPRVGIGECILRLDHKCDDILTAPIRL
jgi:hypothetical protein